MMKRMLKNERGLTLVELLAVVVILGIIAAIAVPSIGALIDNSKKDAHVANARQMINATKLAIASQPEHIPQTGEMTFSLRWLINNGYLEAVKSPDNVDYNTLPAESTQGPTAATTNQGASYVIVTKTGNTYTYSVKLVGTNGRGVQSASTNGTAVSEGSLNRNSVN